jgi:L-asparaginase
VTRVQRVAVVSLGGTIASVAAESGGPVAPALSPEELIRAVPGLGGGDVEVTAVDVRRLPGSALALDDVRAVARAASGCVAEGAAGVVVTQGTDTIEETSFALDLLWDHAAPLVVTGAMRHAAMAGADGPANLLAAVTTAASPVARGLGCVVVMADEIHAAREVRKAHTTSVAAFTSPGAGPIGHVTEGTAYVRWRPDRPVMPDLGAVARDGVRVGVVPAVLGDDGAWLPDLAARFDGLVVAAFGAGHVPPDWVDALAAAAADRPVVLASRTGAGRVATATYGFPGSEADLLSRRLVHGGSLDPYKARVLLTLLLAAGADDAAIRSAFARFSAP